MSLQLDHSTHSESEKKFPIVILTDNITGEANIGSLFRLADAFNIEKILFSGTPINLKSNRLRRTARGTFEKVVFEHTENILETIENYKAKSYMAVALEITSDSVALDVLKLKNDSKVLLIIGNERHGISQLVLDAIQTKVHIPMFGNNSSMNVSQATGIALYEFSKTFLNFRQK
ncbi:SpoU rRNA methylase family protein [Gillisia mitskevichiae]|uniref:SpoU rRNA methylase family protein n=1 Tax=Gillisia mitskevichiae TaxID=270921 RepID=A0A495PTR5_9FLAO|nr:TrmH family RNA methyltransferase [Gillisia mitskevichiae]RKS53140.1 SpoU rRNA methylase family protein [Gillisia mitskevichiae]